MVPHHIACLYNKGKVGTLALKTDLSHRYKKVKN